MSRIQKVAGYCASEHTWESLRALKLQQQNKCAICNRPLKDLKNKNVDSACLDHEHSTGKVRSVLCLNCNIGLGYFLDNPTLLLKAAHYLNRWNKLEGVYFHLGRKLQKYTRLYCKTKEINGKEEKGYIPCGAEAGGCARD